MSFLKDSFLTRLARAERGPPAGTTWVIASPPPLDTAANVQRNDPASAMHADAVESRTSKHRRRRSTRKGEPRNGTRKERAEADPPGQAERGPRRSRWQNDRRGVRKSVSGEGLEGGDSHPQGTVEGGAVRVPERGRRRLSGGEDPPHHAGSYPGSSTFSWLPGAPTNSGDAGDAIDTALRFREAGRGLSAAQRMRDVDQHAAALEIFTRFDTNGDGVLSYEEHAEAEREVLKRLGVNADAAHLRATFNQYDTDNNGGIDFKEFTKGLWLHADTPAADGVPGEVQRGDNEGALEMILSRLAPEAKAKLCARLIT